MAHGALSGSPPTSAGGAYPAVAARSISKGFYLTSILGSFGLGIILLIPALILIYGDRGRNAMVGLPFACGSQLLALYGAVILAILIFKMWAAIQGEQTTRTTPGKAVGFLFIPLFNFYWVFQAYWGWARDYNSFIEARGINGPRAPTGVALTLCILALLGVIPLVNLFVSLVSFVIVGIFVSAAISCVNAVAAAASTDQDAPRAQL